MQSAVDSEVSLDGEWRAIVATDDLRRSAIVPDFDDSDTAGWSALSVPGHWRQSAAFASSDGPLLYRRHYRMDGPEPGRRRWLTFDGLFYQADVWLDGAYLGDPEGYFMPHSFDVTALSRLGRDHVVAVELSCAPQPSTVGRRSLTGAYQGGVGMPPDWNPGGLWRSVHLHETGPVRISALRVLCRDADDKRAHLRITARLDSDDHRTVTLTTFVNGTDVRRREQPVADGSNEVEWGVDIVAPSLWWPRRLGDQVLSAVAVEVAVDGHPSDRAVRTTGLRQVAWDGWVCSINSERLFLKGADVLPSRPWPATAEPDVGVGDVERALDLGLDAIRLHEHLPPHDLLDAADAAGVLVLQDFPLRGIHARASRQQAIDQASVAVDQYGHHPSIIAWIAHDDPTAADLDPPPRDWRSRLRRAARQQLPTWNKTMLDRYVRRAFESADPSRVTIAYSGVPAQLPRLNGTDAHLWYGWRKGDVGSLETLARLLPSRVRFVSEFGAASVPGDLPLPGGMSLELVEARWPAIDWSTFAAAYTHEQSTLLERLPPDDYASYTDWSAATRTHQAETSRRTIEVLRRLKYHPTGGFCIAFLADPAPGITPALFDHERRPKPAAEAVRAACAPVIVVASPPARVDIGTTLKFDVHVVNDERFDIDGATVVVALSWVGGGHRAGFSGAIDADSVQRVGRVELLAPDQLGTATIDLTLLAGQMVLATNTYRVALTVPPD